MRRLAFWVAAAVISAGIAYAVTVPGALEQAEPTVEPPPEASEATEADEAETVEAALPQTDAVPPSEAESPRDAEAARRPFAEPVLQAPTGLLPEPPAPAGAPEQADPAPTAGPLVAPQQPSLSGGVSPGQSPPAAGPLAAPLRQPQQPQQPRRATVDELALDTLSFDAECGLVLRPMGERAVIFAAGVALDPIGAPAAISLDGEVVALRRVAVDGEPLGYSQFSRQLFQDEAETLQVMLEIALDGEGVTTDSARVSGGEVTVAVGERPVAQLEVGGRAGC